MGYIHELFNFVCLIFFWQEMGHNIVHIIVDKYPDDVYHIKSQWRRMYYVSWVVKKEGKEGRVAGSIPHANKKTNN